MKYGLSGKSITVNMATLAPSSSVTSSKAVTVTRMVSAVGIVSSKGRHVMIPEIGPNKKIGHIHKEVHITLYHLRGLLSQKQLIGSVVLHLIWHK